jgi:hypothetical protein
MPLPKSDISLPSKAIPSCPSFDGTDAQVAAEFEKHQDSSANTIAAISGETEFEALEHSVYCGRERLGQYSRVGPKLYAAFDAKNRMLGEFKSRADAYAAISIAHNAPARTPRIPKRSRR